MTVRFTTVREDFPPNIEDLKIQQLLLYFAGAAGKFEIDVTNLTFTPQNGQLLSGGGAQSIGGVISTRSGSAGSWKAMIDNSPVGPVTPAGEWVLALPNTEEMKNR